MKGMFKYLLSVSLTAICLFCFTGCENNKGVIGTWKHYSYTYSFKEDGTGSYSAGNNKMKFTYKDDGKKVSILYEGNTSASDYEYKIDGNKLIIKDSFGSDVEYTRK